MLHKMKIVIKIFVDACSEFQNVHLIMVDESCTVIEIRNLHTCKFEGKSTFLS